MRLVSDRRSAAPPLPVLTPRFDEFIAVRGVAAFEAAVAKDVEEEAADEDEEDEEDEDGE
jgi:hypothetical protein